MISHKNSANAVGGKTARPCDNCIKKRARWYCAADDAFLCQSCDASVHTANPLARRHERVRLKTAASHSKHLHELMVHAHQMKKSRESNSSSSAATWHKGFVKKPRTPRNKKASDRASRNPFLLVPEVGGDETSNEENDRDEFLLYRVPSFDQSFALELCNSKDGDLMVRDLIGESKAIDSIQEEKGSGVDHLENLRGFLSTDADLAEFAADMESLLGRGDESFGIEELGLMECKDGSCDVKECSLSGSGEAVIKLEEEETGIVDGAREGEIDMANETFELSFDYGSPTTCCEEDKRDIELEEVHAMKVVDANKKRKMILSLDYDGVVTAWASQGSPSPWTRGDRPKFDLDDCWQDWESLCGPEFQNGHFGGGGRMGIGNAGREAKVSRYREKRRTRLFSKKIRYEVRKLNAEKRPRMKGRFVKRASLMPPTFPSLTK